MECDFVANQSLKNSEVINALHLSKMGGEVAFDRGIDFDNPLADVIKAVCEMGARLLIFKQKIRDRDHNLDWLLKPTVELDAEQ